MKKTLLLPLLVILTNLNVSSQDTFSIVAVDSVTGEVGSAGASCVDLISFPGFSDDFLGELFPGVGAINTQAWYDATNQANARARMNAGDTPSQIITYMVANDVAGNPTIRQYGIAALINNSPQTDAHTGINTDNYKNHILGPNYSIQGNILLGQEVLDSMESRFLNEPGDLACKLMAALQGAKMVGADTRCATNGTSSLFAFVKVAQPSDVFGNPSFLQSVRTSSGAGIEPIDTLQTLFNASHNCFGLDVTDKESFAAHFSLYPNPTDNKITIISKINGNKSYKLEIINTIGGIVYNNILQKDKVIDISSYPKGVYFLRLSNDEGAYTSRIVKN